VRWSFAAGDVIHASPAVSAAVVYIGSWDRNLYALDAAIRIDLQNKAVSFSSPAIAADVAFYGTSDGFLNPIGLRDGALLARFQTDGSKENGPRLLDENGLFRPALMYPDRTLDGMMIGMRTMMTLGPVLSSPVVADGIVYFGSTDGHLYAVR